MNRLLMRENWKWLIRRQMQSLDTATVRECEASIDSSSALLAR